MQYIYNLGHPHPSPSPSPILLILLIIKTRMLHHRLRPRTTYPHASDPSPNAGKTGEGGGGTLTIPKAHVDVHPALPRRYPPLIADRDIEHAPALAVFFLSRGLFERFRITLHAREFRKQEKTGGGGSADIHRWM